jgi:hypothetical protein
MTPATTLAERHAPAPASEGQGVEEAAALNESSAMATVGALREPPQPGARCKSPILETDT